MSSYRKLKKLFKKSTAELLSLTYGGVRRTYLAEFYREYGKTWFNGFTPKKILYQIRHDAYNPKYFLKEGEWDKYDVWRDRLLRKPIVIATKYHALKKKEMKGYYPATSFIVEFSDYIKGNV